MKIAFLDRDGTIIKDYPDEEWKHIQEPEFIDGSIEALKNFQAKGYEIIIITNQYIINDGIITIDQYQDLTNKLLKELSYNGIKILDIFYCPHSKDENCSCCKPEKGMIDSAMVKYNNIEMDKSFIVGDSLCDIELGNKLGIKTYGIKIARCNLDFVSISSLKDIIDLL